jgi:hypothetical protein
MNLVEKNPQNPYPANGGYGFKDPRTGREFNGLHSSARDTALKIIEHRRGNPHIYHPGESQWFDGDQVRQEIYQQKFQTMPELFIGFGEQPKSATDQKCSCGEQDWETEYCKGCSGKRVVGYKCRKCGLKK